MKKIRDNKYISTVLQTWYAQNKRDLPWRETSDPYVIWVSEIILQQTRVNQGYDYFLRFVQKFPNVQSLAHANEDEVLKMWQGLGYYSRARNLHAAAKQIVNDFNGVFPEKHQQILSLKGIGDYTAAAVASIAFNKPYAVIDGNVYRVLSRLFAIEDPMDTSSGKKVFSETAQSILDTKNPGNHNQAIMDFGAVICTPLQPKCDVCPLQTICLAYQSKNVTEFPKKRGKTKVKERFFNYFHVEQNNYTFIKKRSENDIWKNLYEFPLIETESQEELPQLFENPRFKELFKNSIEISLSHKLSLKHVLTHRIIYVNFYNIKLSGTDIFDTEKNFLKIETSNLFAYPVSRLIHKYIETLL